MRDQPLLGLLDLRTRVRTFEPSNGFPFSQNDPVPAASSPLATTRSLLHNAARTCKTQPA